jgi:hypothetical protein
MSSENSTEAPSFGVWELRVRVLLAKGGFNRRHADVAITEAEEYCAETGQSAYELFGPPDAFADMIAGEVEPVEDTDEHSLWDRLWSVVVLVGWNALLWSCLLAVVTWSLTWQATPTRLAQLGLLTLALGLGVVVPATLRDAGLPRPAMAAYALPAAAVLAAVAVQFGGLSTRPLFTVPHVLVAAAGLVVIIAMFATIRGSDVPEPTDDETGRLRDLVHRLAGSPEHEPDQWFRRLHGLLVGRHDLTPGRAVRLVEEARAHLADTGRSPEDEFGPVGTYAAAVAGPATPQPLPWYRRRGPFTVVLSVAMALVPAMLLVDLFQQHWARAAIDAVLLAGIVYTRLKWAARKLPTDTTK